METVHINFDPSLVNTKCQRTSSSSMHVHFDGVSVLPINTAAKVNTKKDLFDCLAQNFQAVAKTLEEIRELD